MLKLIIKASILKLIHIQKLITSFHCTAGAMRMALTSGMEGTHGEPIGENMACSELKWDRIIWELRLIAHGPYHHIPNQQ